jgi:SAM-dependent methyltransferase
MSDWSQVFDADYLHFYEEYLTPERSDREAALIASLLGLESGLRVLDMPCGYGRIANRLAALGCRVYGLDVSALFLARAAADARRHGVPASYVRGDLRRPPWRGQFDRALCWFTSFGYFDERADLDLLRTFRRLLRPSGRLLLEQVSREQVLASLAQSRPAIREVVERGDDFMIDKIHFDEDAGRLVTERTVLREGRVRRFEFSLRLYSRKEIRDLLSRTGFRQAYFHDQEGGPHGLTSRRLLALAEA